MLILRAGLSGEAAIAKAFGLRAVDNDDHRRDIVFDSFLFRQHLNFLLRQIKAGFRTKFEGVV
ncbi:MAG: hypothetical protein CMP97_02860 [Gammaproteobacteria bacterium]|nr:hypothetical protein [Gammaproteobacteria bacterium]